MKKYPKIQSVFNRDPNTNFRNLLLEEYSTPEIEYLHNNEWEFTEKVDGMNIRIIIHEDGTVGFRGRTDNAQLPPALLERLGLKFTPLKEKLAVDFPDGGCLYGEGFGAGIQKGGGNYSRHPKFVLFDVLVGDWWLCRDAVNITATYLGIESVPVIGKGTLLDMVEIVDGGFASAWGNFQAEGIVARPKVELFARNGERIICKLKTKDFA